MLPALADDNDFLNTNQNKQDENLFVKFDERARIDKVETAKQGTEIYREVIYIDIRIPGQKDSICRPMHDGDKKRFPRHWKAYQDRTTDIDLIGTPLKEWTGITKTNAAEMAFVNILTVEQLATAADVQVSKFMGGFKLKERAVDYLEQMKSEKPFKEIKLENAEMKSIIQDLQETVANLVAQNIKNEAAKPGTKKATKEK